MRTRAFLTASKAALAWGSFEAGERRIAGRPAARQGRLDVGLDPDGPARREDRGPQPNGDGRPRVSIAMRHATEIELFCPDNDPIRAGAR